MRIFFFFLYGTRLFRLPRALQHYKGGHGPCPATSFISGNSHRSDRGAKYPRYIEMYARAVRVAIARRAHNALALTKVLSIIFQQQTNLDRSFFPRFFSYVVIQYFFIITVSYSTRSYFSSDDKIVAELFILLLFFIFFIF